jgi:hypothetical protein
MFRLAGLLLILGLALGLWIGFDPQEHQKAVQAWSEAKASFVNIQTQVSLKFHEWAAESNPGTQTVSVSVTKPIAEFWRQLSSILVNLWNSIVTIWLRIIHGLKLHKS